MKSKLKKKRPHWTSPTQINTRGTVYYYCSEIDPTNLPESVLILLISQQLHNFFENPLAHIFIHANRHFGWYSIGFCKNIGSGSVPLNLRWRGRPPPPYKCVWVTQICINRERKTGAKTASPLLNLYASAGTVWVL